MESDTLPPGIAGRVQRLPVVLAVAVHWLAFGSWAAHGVYLPSSSAASLLPRNECVKFTPKGGFGGVW